MEKNQLFQALWERYTKLTPSAKKIHRIFEERGETVENDHIAIRTFKDPRIGIDVLALPFKELGYEEKGEYVFKEKKLFARHYQHPEGHGYPKIFISELLLDQCSDELNRIVKDLLEKIPYHETVMSTLLLQGRLWDINFQDYEILRKESEYASWMYIYGFCANHFTVFVNYLKTFNTLEEVNDFLKANGFTLNDAGGEIKGSPEELLEQSSTVADLVDIDFGDGIKQIPACYYEFARRYKMDNGELYQGFIAASADKIFESTNVSMAEKTKNKTGN